MESNEYRPHPAKAFFAVFLSGVMLLGIMNMGRRSGDPYVAQIISGSNMGGILLAAIIAAATKKWSFPVFAKVAVFHVIGSVAAGFLGGGMRGFAVALGSSVPIALIYALPCWLMLSRDWIIGKICFWGLASWFIIGLALHLIL